MSHHSLARFANFSISRGSTLLDDIVAPVPLFASDARSLLAHHIPALRDAIAIPTPRPSIVHDGGSLSTRALLPLKCNFRYETLKNGQRPNRKRRIEEQPSDDDGRGGSGGAAIAGSAESEDKMPTSASRRHISMAPAVDDDWLTDAELLASFQDNSGGVWSMVRI